MKNFMHINPVIKRKTGSPDSPTPFKEIELIGKNHSKKTSNPDTVNGKLH